MDAEPELSFIRGSPHNAVFQTVKCNCEIYQRNFLFDLVVVKTPNETR